MSSKDLNRSLLNNEVSQAHPVPIHAEVVSHNDNYVKDENDRHYFYLPIVVCGIISLIVFMLLFFLIPRQPRTDYQRTYVYFDPYIVIQKYKVTNDNMYSLKINNLKMKLKSGDLVAEGTFAKDQNSQTISKQSSEYMYISYDFSGYSQSEIHDANSACFSDDGVTYRTSGTMNMKTWVTNFKDVSFGK
jgi:hypothetical protein